MPTACSSKKSGNVFCDNRGHPDESDDFDQLLHTINGGTILRKKKFPTPPIDNWSTSFSDALKYIVCQLRICKAYRLTPSLKKSHFFPKHLEFVHIDVSPDGNRPAMSKHELLKHWPTPVLVRDVASFVGFLQFYSKFIPNFEIRVEPLQKIMARECTKEVGDLWTPEAQSTFNDLRNSILSDPCL